MPQVVADVQPASLVPRCPQPYVAHPYALLETQDLIGRRAELQLLSDWIRTPEHPALGAPLFVLAALGGMGKSALTWKWFNDVAAVVQPALAGRVWWSFYEMDATFENFVARVLAMSPASLKPPSKPCPSMNGRTSSLPVSTRRRS